MSEKLVDDDTVNKRTQNVLMLVAHPDDETLFGFYDLIHSNCTVLCFTNKNNKVRRRNFIEVMNTTKQTGIMFDYKDGVSEVWETISDDNFIGVIVPLLSKKYDMIVSHNSDGEYGHIQHKRVHSIAVSLSKKLDIPYKSFLDRFDTTFYIDNTKLLDTIMNIYKTEKYSKKMYSDFLYKQKSSAV
jgi:LmbE family N-acetylglucosaminyl deacetylase